MEVDPIDQFGHQPQRGGPYCVMFVWWDGEEYWDSDGKHLGLVADGIGRKCKGPNSAKGGAGLPLHTIFFCVC